MNELYVYTTPDDAEVTLALDSGVTITGQGPITVNGRSDAHCCQLPPGTPGQGAVLTVDAPDYEPFGPHRGLIVPSETGEAKFQLDDVHLAAAVAVAPPEPEPAPGPPSSDPATIIDEVYATGRYNLATHDGCGQFTEACCTELHERNNVMWGHIKKQPGQNQYNGHAVDAVQCLAGEDHGIWDIITESVSSSAAPAFNRMGAANPALWYYPVDEAGTMELRVVPVERPKPTPARRR